MNLNRVFCLQLSMKTETRGNMKHDRSNDTFCKFDILLSQKEDSMNSRKRKVTPWFESLKILSSLLF